MSFFRSSHSASSENFGSINTAWKDTPDKFCPADTSPASNGSGRARRSACLFMNTTHRPSHLLPHRQRNQTFHRRRTAILPGIAVRPFMSGTCNQINSDITSSASCNRNASADKVKGAAMDEKYTYRPLQGAQSFRLMTLLPGRGRERLQCKLNEASYGTEEYYESLPKLMPLISGGGKKRIHVEDTSTGKVSLHHSMAMSLGDRSKPKIPGPPPYEALSYVWGSHESPASIFCDSQELSITRNLAQALYQLRSEDKPLVLWIDGICINQNDIMERAQQVKLMGLIYRGASSVSIWLGEEDEYTKVAYTFLTSWMKNTAKAVEASGKLKTGKPIALDGFAAEPSLEEFTALERLFSREWFSRAWTYQESWLSRNSVVRCGTFSVSGGELLFALMQIRANGEGCRNAWVMFGQRIYYESNLPALFDLCAQRRAVGATDPRDLVYSLLEVTNDGQSIEPDYSKSVEEVYASLALQRILSRGDFSIFYHIPQYIHRSGNSFPTWVPDWRMKMKRQSSFTHARKRIYGATGSATASPEPFGDWKVRPAILVSGILMEPMGPPLWNPKPTGWPEIVTELRAEMRRLELPAEVYGPTGELLDHAFLRTIFADVAPGRGERQRWTKESFAALLQEKPSLSYWKDAIQGEYSIHQLFLTESFHIGLSLFGAKEGDLIFLLLGAEVPVLLRPYEDGFIFIGECYVHGLMDGEGLIEARKSADPDYDPSDTSWLQQLHEKPLPFDVDKLILY